MNLLAPIPVGRLVAYVGALGAMIGLGWYLGAGHVQGRWDAATAAQEAKYIAQLQQAQATSQGWQKAANDREKERDQAQSDLAAYRASHPVRVLVCPKQKPPTLSHNPPGEPAGPQTAPVLQPESADIGPALDQLMAEADAINEAYRTCKADYEALVTK